VLLHRGRGLGLDRCLDRLRRDRGSGRT
jgi:hypothetical protein